MRAAENLGRFTGNATESATATGTATGTGTATDSGTTSTTPSETDPDADPTDAELKSADLKASDQRNADHGNADHGNADPTDTASPPPAPPAGPPARKDTAGRRAPRSLTPRILITTTPEQLRDATNPTGHTCDCQHQGHQRGRPPNPGHAEAQEYGPITPQHLARSLCDAILQRVLLAPNGAVLNLGRAQRTVTPRQKLALTARDTGCVIPGCTLPAEWCDAHHVQHWSDNGPSDIDNYALLCPHHHDQIHQGTWELTMINGIPWARPPAWIDPHQRLIRNTYRDHQHHARALGEALRQALEPATGPAAPPRREDPPGELPPEQRIPSNH